MKTVTVFLVSFVLTFLLTPLVRWFCLRYSLLDIPSARKVHTRAVPRLGGIAVAVSFIFTILLTCSISVEYQHVFYPKIPGLLAAVTVLCFIGIWDDVRGMRPIGKLIGQVATALILFFADFRVAFFTHPVSGAETPLPYFLSMLLTLFWVIGMINAVNLIDGLDGLATGIVCISSFCMLFVGFYLKSPVTMLFFSVVCGSSLGFLYYNFPPAKIFLGDTGSMFLGLLMAVAGLVGFQFKLATAVTLIVPICVMAIPIYDAALAILRRIRKKGSVFVADKKHLHHRFLEFGFSQRQIVAGFYLATMYFGIIAFLFVLIRNHYALILLVLLAMGLFMGIRAIGFIERKIKLIHRLESQQRK